MSRIRPTILVLALALLAIASPYAIAVDKTFPTATPESQGVSEAALEAIATAIDGFVERDYCVGAELLIIKNRRTILHRAFGLADREDETPWATGTICNIRSMTKPIVAAALQIQVDRGKVDLDAPVATYLPGFDTDAARAITVRQVITHRAGLPLTVITEAIDQYENLIAQANAVGAGGPEFEVDSKFWYSDAGADVIGALVEVTSGERLDEFVRREIFEPLGMHDTFFGIDSDDPRLARVASLYVGTSNAWIRYWHHGKGAFYPFPWGSQTIYSTPNDYARFLAMWMDRGTVGGRSVLSEAAVDRMLTPVSRMGMLGSDQLFPTSFRGLEVHYGHMAALYCEQGHPEAAPVILSHSGSDGTIVWAWPKEDLMVLYFTQSRGGTTALRLEVPIDQHLLHDGVPVPTVPVPEAYQPYTGVYIANFASFNKESFTVLFRDGHLALDIPSQMTFDLVTPEDPEDPNAPWRFAIAPDAIHVTFSRDDDGTINLLQLHQSGATFDVPREGSALAIESDQAATVSVEDMQPYVGGYRDSESERVIDIFVRKGVLCVYADDDLVLELRYAPKDDRWQVKQSPAIALSFQRDDTGKVISMTRHIGDQTLVMPRVK